MIKHDMWDDCRNLARTQEDRRREAERIETARSTLRALEFDADALAARVAARCGGLFATDRSLDHVGVEIGCGDRKYVCVVSRKSDTAMVFPLISPFDAAFREAEARVPTIENGKAVTP